MNTNFQKETFMTSNPKYAAKYSSQLLISTLIASSLLMVNCNKAADRTGVKANTVAGKVSEPSKDVGTKAASTEALRALVDDRKTVECSAEIQQSYKLIFESIEKNSKDQKVSKENAEKSVADCTDFQINFKATQQDQCHYFTEAKKLKKYYLDKAPKICLDVAKVLKVDYDTETEYLKNATDQAKIRKEQAVKKANTAEGFIGEKLIISEEMKAMLKPENLNFKMYIVDGEIKTDADELRKSFADKKVICSFVGTSTAVTEKDKFVFTVNAYEDVDKKDLPENLNATGIAFAAADETKKAESVGFQMLGCSHLMKNKIDVKMLKKALGKHLATETDLKKTPLVSTQANSVDADKKIEVAKKVEEDKKEDN
jgi:hypothetical protein